jgi:UDP-N-acetylmuramoyl-L-alanyl-D-glutamate--2,6-diaminopimelate ligase
VGPQPVAGILCILLEPGLRRTQPEAVTPGIHVRAQSCATNTRNGIGQQDLQIADGILLGIVPARIRMQAIAPHLIQADPVTGLMQDRVQRSGRKRIEDVANQPRFRVAPVGSGDGLAGIQQAIAQTESPQQFPDDSVLGQNDHHATPSISINRIRSHAMPTDLLSHQLATLGFAWHRESATPPSLTNIQWRASACDVGSILFFQRFDDGKTDAELYQRYLADSAFSVLVTNRPLDCFDQLSGKSIYVTRPGEWADTVSRFCDLVYPLETDRLRFIGVTGTNGKTTTIKYLESILTAHGQRVISIGTLGVFLDGQRLVETGFTSPPQIELRRLLHAEQDRCDLVVMEVSSHALDQGRVHGIPLQNAGWTNFTQDHLDYHHDEASYFNAKAGILDLIQDGGRLYCCNRAVAERLRALGQPRIPIDYLPSANVDAQALAAKPFLALRHNRENYALATALADGVLGNGNRRDWEHLQAVDGRFECRLVGDHAIVIDFAHTPDALETILTAIRDGFPGSKVLTLFGCGGDRDRGKRPRMGAAVARHSDHAIVTSDNPRHEEPEQIIADILTGMPAKGREVIVGRAEAVAHLFDLLASHPAGERWVALIAGKGHERYIDRNGHKSYYSDQDEVALNLKRLGWS